MFTRRRTASRSRDLTGRGEGERDDHPGDRIAGTDLVASLRWIRDNIANFGGDPDSVLIYGQSGGGSKVTCLMGMPSVKGLFHRAIAQSGGGGNIPSTGQSRELARQFMKELKLQPNDLASLQKMDWGTLNAAGNAAIAKLSPAGPATAGPPLLAASR